MLSKWISKLLGKSADTDVYIVKIEIAHSRQKDKRVSTKANIQPSSEGNWISKQFIEEHDLLHNISDKQVEEQFEDKMETFTWYYRRQKDGRTYTCEFTSKFKITRQRGFNVLFGSNPIGNDINAGENPFDYTSLKKRTSWKPHLPITNNSSIRRSQSSSIIPKALDDVSGSQGTTELVPGKEVDSNPSLMTEGMMPTISAIFTEGPNGGQTSMTMERYLNSPLEPAYLQDGDRTEAQGSEIIQSSKPRRRRKKVGTNHSGEQLNQQYGYEDNQNSQYWQYDEKTERYYHKDVDSNEIVWYPALD